MNDPRHSFEDADYLYTFERPAPPHVRGDAGKRRVEDERPIVAPERTPVIEVEPTTPIASRPWADEVPTVERETGAERARASSSSPDPLEIEPEPAVNAPEPNAEGRIALSHPPAEAPFDPVRFLAEESERRERSRREPTPEAESAPSPIAVPVVEPSSPIEGVRFEGVEIELEAEPRDLPSVASPRSVGSAKESEPPAKPEREWVSFVNPPEGSAPPATIEVAPTGVSPVDIASVEVAPVANGPSGDTTPSRTTAEYELAITALRRRGRIRLPVTGESMAPVLVPGDEIEVVSRPARDLELGDIVLFAARDPRGRLVGLVVHRLLLDRPEGLIARGDGARSVDPIWPRDSVLGLVEKRVRRGVVTELSPRRNPIGLGVRRLAWNVRTGWLDSLKSRVGMRRKSRRRGGPRHTVGSAMRSPSMAASRSALDAPRVEVRATAPHGRIERPRRERRPVGGVWRKMRRKLRGRG